MEQLKHNQWNEPAIGVNEIMGCFIDDFLQESLEALDSIELELVNLEIDPENQEYLKAVCCSFHTIQGLTGFIEETIAAQITEQTEALLEACRKYNIPVTHNIINMLLQSVLFLRKICNDQGLVKDVRFQGEVGQHLLNIRLLKDEILMDVKQPVRSAQNKIGEILMEEGTILEQDVEEVLAKQGSIYKKMKFGEIAIHEKKLGAGDLIKAIRAQKIRNERNEQTVHIPLQRLDEILGMIAQMENIQKELYHASVLRFDTDDPFSVETMQITNMSMEIRKILTELRLVALKPIFRRLTRAVKAMIEDAGYHVVFTTVGENITLNKEKAEALIIPLAEIVEWMLAGFNSEEKNKERLGNIEVAAYEKEEYVIIEVSINQEMEGMMKQSNRLAEIETKIKKMNGTLSYEHMEGDGCSVMITLAP